MVVLNMVEEVVKKEILKEEEIIKEEEINTKRRRNTKNGLCYFGITKIFYHQILKNI